MSRDDPLVRLKHMRDAALDALTMAEGKSREDLDADDLLASALHYKMIIIGEAASAVSREVTDAAPSIPWREIIGMRNVIIHGYDVVDLDVIWQAATRDVPSLLAELEPLIAQIEAERKQEEASGDTQ